MKTETTIIARRAAKKTAVGNTRLKIAVKNGTEQHVIPLGNGWVVKTGNSKKFTVITDNKKDAIEIAKTIAKTKKAAVVVHGKFGVIESTEPFGL